MSDCREDVKQLIKLRYLELDLSHANVIGPRDPRDGVNGTILSSLKWQGAVIPSSKLSRTQSISMFH